MKWWDGAKNVKVQRSFRAVWQQIGLKHENKFRSWWIAIIQIATEFSLWKLIIVYISTPSYRLAEINHLFFQKKKNKSSKIN